MKKQYIIPIFVPHLGCPNDCIFCNQKSISGQKSNMTKEKAKEIIENYLKSIDKENAQIEIAKRFCKNAHANTPMQPPTINPVNKPIVKYLLLFILLYLP